MSAYNKKLVALVERYKLETGRTEVSSRTVARWMIANGDWKQHPNEPERQCARDISRALGEEYITDPQGRRPRLHHVAIVEPLTSCPGARPTLDDDRHSTIYVHDYTI